MFLLTCTILDGFSAIRLLQTNPTLGGLYAYAVFTVIVTYIGIFQFAYRITDKAEELERLMEFKSGRLTRPMERKYWGLVLKSMPRMQMSLGGFHRVEREAVPVYIDFSVKQIVSILITFR